MLPVCMLSGGVSCIMGESGAFCGQTYTSRLLLLLLYWSCSAALMLTGKEAHHDTVEEGIYPQLPCGCFHSTEMVPLFLVCVARVNWVSNGMFAESGCFTGWLAGWFSSGKEVKTYATGSGGRPRSKHWKCHGLFDEAPAAAYQIIQSAVVSPTFQIRIMGLDFFKFFGGLFFWLSLRAALLLSEHHVHCTCMCVFVVYTSFCICLPVLSLPHWIHVLTC